eukprot:1152876-Pelagomonas_calceolata.AAC.1
MGIERLISSAPCLILVLRVKRNIKSTYRASKFISVFDRENMKLQSKLAWWVYEGRKGLMDIMFISFFRVVALFLSKSVSMCLSNQSVDCKSHGQLWMTTWSLLPPLRLQ